ncbi:amidohydrolase family protein [Qipengyuania sp. MTN3-11]|uniref:amidohydrolase family protein n=1 Tax=Qipengyuania sp. MTN3-11 TaxID=3056557 RepID=UPI0036F1FD05
MNRIALLASAAIAALTAPLAAQDMAISNVTVVSGDGADPVANGAVVIRGGRVVYAGPSANMPASAGAPIDGGGAWVTPGLVAAPTNLGLYDVGAVDESNDSSASSSPFGAALDVAPAINPLSQPILISRAGGVTRAAVMSGPSGSIFGGQGALIDTGADPQAIRKARAFQVVALGESAGRIAGGSRASAHALFRNALREARDYGRDSRVLGSPARPAETRTGDDVPIDPRLIDDPTERASDTLLTRFDAAALVPVLRGEQKLVVAVDRAADIRAVLALKEEFPRLDMVIAGAAEGWMVASEIAAAGVPVLAPALQDLPSSFEMLASTQSNIGRMRDAGVTVGIDASTMRQPRLLTQHAGNLVALTRVPRATGLSWGEAFAAISSIPARIMGMGTGVGTLASGSAGDLVVWDGDPLEVTSSPLRVYIDGVEQPLENHQTGLRDRYRDLDTSDLPKGYDW